MKLNPPILDYAQPYRPLNPLLILARIAVGFFSILAMIGGLELLQIAFSFFRSHDLEFGAFALTCAIVLLYLSIRGAQGTANKLLKPSGKKRDRLRVSSSSPSS